jgi:hypothetical protein
MSLAIHAATMGLRRRSLPCKCRIELRLHVPRQGSACFRVFAIDLMTSFCRQGLGKVAMSPRAEFGVCLRAA